MTAVHLGAAVRLIEHRSMPSAAQHQDDQDDDHDENDGSETDIHEAFLS
jgi:hypothetical protein